jgi:predicted O-methyltransferase YrrM
MLKRQNWLKRTFSGRGRRQTRIAKIARDMFAASPIVDIPFPPVDIHAASCVDDILAAPEFGDATRYFNESPSMRHGLVSARSQALLYALLRNMRPDHAVEIGTYRASTTEAMCRALHANGHGVVHTVEPVTAEWVPHIIALWPEALRNRVRFYPMNSAAFFANCRIRSDFIFIDGNHDFEYALFDMQAAARIAGPGGLVVIDNISQPGPFFAARRFCRDNPGWSEIGGSLSNYREGYPFDTRRATIAGTDFCILRAPDHFSLDSHPNGQTNRLMTRLREISIVPVGKPRGTLHLQCIVRTYADPPIEQTIERQIVIDGGDPQLVRFDPPIVPVVENVPFTVELWLSWEGAEPLRLASAPAMADCAPLPEQ